MLAVGIFEGKKERKNLQMRYQQNKDLVKTKKAPNYCDKDLQRLQIYCAY